MTPPLEPSLVVARRLVADWIDSKTYKLKPDDESELRMIVADALLGRENLVRKELQDELGMFQRLATEAMENATEAMSGLNILTESAKELLGVLKEKWNPAPEIDALALYCASFIMAIYTAWKGNPPENGFTSCITIPQYGKLEIDIHRIDGNSAATSLQELTKERDELLERLREISADAKEREFND